MKRFVADLPNLEPTPSDVFFDRREFLSALSIGVAAAGTIGSAAQAQSQSELDAKIITPPFQRKDVFPAKLNGSYKIPEAIGGDLTPRVIAASHNNFYEFLPGRGGPVYQFTDDFVVDPWKVEIGGLCNNPMTLDLDGIFSFPHEERTYHFRCVERWAMNVPWSGFPLSELIKKADPQKEAKYVTFVSAKKDDQMPGIREAHWYSWPYFEALRLDEAMNELAFCVTGAYGEPLLKQHGAPLRIAVPWKYGYKNPKSIVKIEFVSEQPKTFWQVQPHEYGFVSNVNPFIPHPRWSQAQSHWLHNNEPFQTPIFNGYEKYVAALYPDEPKTLQEPLTEGQMAR